MIETLKKKTLKSAIITSIFLFIIGIVMVIFQGNIAYHAIVGYTEFESLSVDKIKHQVVDVSLVENYGCFEESGEKNTSTGRTTIYNLYYVVLTGDPFNVDYDEEYRFMAIRVPASYEKKMDQMADNTANYYYSDPISFSGEIRKLDGDDYKYFKEYFISAGWTEEEFESETLPYYIHTFQSKTSSNIIALVITIGGLVLIIVGIVRIVGAANGTHLKKLRQDFSDAGVSESTAEADYSSARSFTKKGELKVGRLFIFNSVSSTPRAIPTAKLVWAYQNTVTHRTNGIKTGTTYNVVFYVDGQKNSQALPMPNEATVQEVLKEINARFPWVVVGYSDELKRMFNKDRQQFLGLRYNTVEHVAVDPAFNADNTSSEGQNS